MAKFRVETTSVIKRTYIVEAENIAFAVSAATNYARGAVIIGIGSIDRLIDKDTKFESVIAEKVYD